MLKILIVITLSLNIALAKSRFTDADKTKFMEEVKQGIATHKVENNGKVDLQIIKPELFEELADYHKQEKFTREEMVKIKQRYEDFSKAQIDPVKTEEEFYKFVEVQLSEINKSHLAKIKEGEICNNWSCEDGLKCAQDPKQEDGRTCKKERTECKDDKDCCSSSCVIDNKSKKAFCKEVYRCYRPVALGGSCQNNPVCGEGECLIFNSMTSGIGECEDNGRSCKKNSDCCSNSCERNKCIESHVCKDCVKNGNVAQRGQKCCEGLYLNEKGKCVPDIPPVVMPQVNLKSKLINLLASFFISNTYAQSTTPDAEAAKKAKAEKIAKEFASKVGAKSSSPDDIAKALETYKETPEDVAKLKELAAADATYKELYDKVLANEEAEEAENLKQVELDKSNMTQVILENKDKYSNYTAKSIEADKVNMKSKEMILTRKSDFKTCDIRFKDDFFNYLKANGLYDYELSLLAFDFVLLGDGVNDYWTMGTSPETSIYGRLKSIATKHQAARVENFKRIDEISKKLQCMCLDVKGYKNISDSGKKIFFKESCDEYAKYKDLNTSEDEKEGDASGIKGKRLLVRWTESQKNFFQLLTVDNQEIGQGFADIATWVDEKAEWNQAETKKFDLKKFTVLSPTGVSSMGAILGALVAAGVIAVLGGFATTSVLAAWAAAGIIATSAVAGGTGFWLIASLKGAWVSKRPQISDDLKKTYGCTYKNKKTCVDYNRELHQPYNKICNAHVSANACVKNFVVYYQENEPRYIVDPWIPYDSKKSLKNLILRDISDQRNYAQKMEDGFQAALAHMKAKPLPSWTNKYGTFVHDDYLRAVFIDADVLGKYTPKIGNDDKRYIIDETISSQIKSSAKDFAIREKFFEEGDKENLEKFAEYAFTYHFLWPKTSRKKEISYPTIGLSAYLGIMSNGISGSMASGSATAAIKFGNLHAQQLEDYLKTLELYRAAGDTINQIGPAGLKLLDDEIANAKMALENQQTLNAFANNTNLDKQLLAIRADAVKSSGSNDGKLTTDQTNYLKAIGNLRLKRKEQLKKLEFYNKAIAANGNAERAAKVASAAKSFTSKFANPTGGVFSKQASSIFGTGGMDGLKSGEKAKPEPANSNMEGAGYNTYSLGQSGAGYSAGKSRSEGQPAKSDVSGTGVSDEDSRRLAEAIEARDKANREKYKSNDEQTIFEKVTNAYIRNYDKVLIKKKDKDVIEKK